jgi:regulator of protease activity HflC (stomatin/prohibitin superfamily)
MLRWSRIRALLLLAVVGGVGWGLFMWVYARVEVEPDTFLVVTNRWGRALPDGELVAPDASYKGIQRRVLSEGRHFLNPFLHTVERHPVVKVPEKLCAVLIRKSGTEVSSERKTRGEYLAHGALDLEAAGRPGERGIIEQVLGPGKYRLNPHVYDVQIVPAVEVESQQVGVKVLLWGGDPPKDKAGAYIVADGHRGVQRSIVPSGTHYINPYVARIVPVDVRSHTVVFEDIEFPSKDGFTIEPRVQVRYKVVPEKAPELFVMLAEQGVLHQKDDTHDDQLKNPILQKVILPLIRGYVRIEGSKHDAREYISKPKEDAAPDGKATNPRERLQEELMVKVKPECEKLGITIDYIAVGQPRMNPTLEELATQIREREQARITRSTNVQKVTQFEREQELKSTEALAARERLLVEAETRLERAKIDAKRQLQNAEAEQRAKLESAQFLLDGARKKAEAIETTGKADAAVQTAQNDATVAGLRAAIEGFGSVDAFAQYHIVQKLAPALAEIFTSDESEFAKLISGYLLPRAARGVVAPPPRDKAIPVAGGDD